MKLHENQEEFKSLVALSSDYFGIREVFIEKDYWVTFILKNLSQSEHKDKVVFKGGTSLSKAYKLINRFSEDIDLAYIEPKDVTRSKRKSDFSNIDKAITLKPLINVEHPDQKKGPQHFRKTFHKYPRLIENSDFGEASDFLILEINSFTVPAPHGLMPITSYIYDFLKDTNQSDVISEFNLDEFKVNVLDKSRTLAEKLCGLAKFTNMKDEDNFSYFKSKIRHLYDVSKLLDDTDLKEYVLKNEFVELVKSVRLEDIENFSNASWINKKFSEAKIYSETNSVLNIVSDYFYNEFSSLVYHSENLPEIGHLSEQIKTIYIQLKKVDNEML